MTSAADGILEVRARRRSSDLAGPEHGWTIR